MVENDILFQTKRAKKKPFGVAHTYTAYIRDYPQGEKRIADYDSRCLHKRDLKLQF